MAQLIGTNFGEAVQSFERENEAIPGFCADELNNLRNIHFRQNLHQTGNMLVFDLIIEMGNFLIKSYDDTEN